jgi:hypothetical protein
MDAEALVEATAGTVNGLGATYYFHPDSLARGKEAGLDGFRLYIVGRGGVLGDCHADVVSSAFGYFNPAVIAKMWNSGRETMAPMDVAQLYLDCNADIGRGALDNVEGLDAFCAAAEAVVQSTAPAGLPLFAATAAMPMPDDLPGRAMQLLVLHRELRGSIHLAAIVAQGLASEHAHAIRRPDDLQTFGWADGVDVPDGAAEKLAAADAMTDAVHANCYRSLTDEQRQDFVDGVAAIQTAFAS